MKSKEDGFERFKEFQASIEVQPKYEIKEFGG
jgi:hypothetical protein